MLYGRLWSICTANLIFKCFGGIHINIDLDYCTVDVHDRVGGLAYDPDASFPF